MSNATEETLRGSNRAIVVTDLLDTGTEKTSPAAAGYAVSTTKTGFAKYQGLVVVGSLLGATGGTLDVVVETSYDGTDWFELVHFTQLSAGGAAATSRFCLSPTGGAASAVVGKNLTTTTVVASGAAVNGIWGDSMRVRFVAGTSTSAGAIQAVSIIGLVNGK